MNDKPTLDNITFSFTQEGNCVDGRSDDYEKIEIQVKSSLGIDFDNGGFFVLKTEQWAINDIEEMTEMLQRVQDALDVVIKNNPHKK
jgi:hypothetical protein